MMPRYSSVCGHEYEQRQLCFGKIIIRIAKDSNDFKVTLSIYKFGRKFSGEVGLGRNLR